MKKSVFLIVTLFLFAASAVCADIDGLWVGEIDGMDGQKLAVTYLFKAEGTILQGGIQTSLGTGPISEGKINGNNIEFTLNAGDNIVIKNNGTLSGDEIQLTETIGKEKIKVALKRVKQ